MSDRIQYDDDRLDEVVLSDCTFHIERMSHHGWWMAASDKAGKRISFWFDMASEPVCEMDAGPVAGVEIIRREPLSYYCKATWTSGSGDHQCDVERPHARHRCECGATRRGANV